MQPADPIPPLVRSSVRQFPWRSVALGAWILALVAVAVAYGARRRDVLLERRAEEILTSAERVLSALALAPDAAPGVQPLPGSGQPARVDASGAEFARRDATAWARLAAGERRARSGDQWWLAQPTPTGFLVAVVPDAALESRLAPERRELTLVLWGSAGALLATALTVAVVVRRRLWDFRARETAQYVVAIRREGAKWKALTESAADAILIVEPGGALLERNRAAQAMLGGATLQQCLSAQDFAELTRGMQQALGQPGEAVALRELALRARDGSERRVDVRLAGIELGDERVVELSLRDVTRERAMERQLATSERLSSLGLLTAGVAHEINNPLEGISNYLSLLERGDLPAEKRARYVEQTRVGFERIRDIVRDLLSFARPGVEHGEADLREVVERVRKLVGYTKSFGEVEVEVRGLDGPLTVPGDRGRLEQVLLNLLLNAGTAMGGRGRVVVEVERLRRGAGGEPAVRITVDDHGPGIPQGNLSRIFDPFFTTTQGNGLGLSISYGIVRAHGGTLSASNRPEGGARLTIELPAARSAEPNAAHEEPWRSDRAS